MLYHLAVLLRGRGLSLADAEEVLEWPSPLSPSCASASSPALDEVRALAAEHNLVPVRQTFLEDCETPVSAFLKLRGAGPAFLLESAEQGQRVGRWSFIGYRPRRVLRWSLADGGDPYALAAAEVAAPAPGAAARACRRSRAARSASSATTACARSSRWARRTRTRSGCPTWR